jgi:hypothetical protein
MNELNIYTHFNYRKLRKKANLYFDKKYVWYYPHTVFAPKHGKFTLSLGKNSIRICYWDEDTEEGKAAKEYIKQFIEDNFSHKTIGITYIGKCDIIKDFDNIKTIQIQ